MYRLKNGQEGFEVVDGPDAGKSFRRGKTYPSVPAGYENRFDKVSGGNDAKKPTKPKAIATEMSAIADTPAKKEGTE